MRRRTTTTTIRPTDVKDSFVTPETYRPRPKR